MFFSASLNLFSSLSISSWFLLSNAFASSFVSLFLFKASFNASKSFSLFFFRSSSALGFKEFLMESRLFLTS